MPAAARRVILLLVSRRTDVQLFVEISAPGVSVDPVADQLNLPVFVDVTGYDHLGIPIDSSSPVRLDHSLGNRASTSVTMSVETLAVWVIGTLTRIQPPIPPVITGEPAARSLSPTLSITSVSRWRRIESS